MAGGGEGLGEGVDLMRAHHGPKHRKGLAVDAADAIGVGSRALGYLNDDHQQAVVARRGVAVAGEAQIAHRQGALAHRQARRAHAVSLWMRQGIGPGAAELGGVSSQRPGEWPTL